MCGAPSTVSDEELSVYHIRNTSEQESWKKLSRFTVWANHQLLRRVPKMHWSVKSWHCKEVQEQVFEMCSIQTSHMIKQISLITSIFCLVYLVYFEIFSICCSNEYSVHTLKNSESAEILCTLLLRYFGSYFKHVCTLM